MNYVRASTEGITNALRKEAQGKREDEVIFPVAVDNHRRLPRPLDVPIPGAPDAIG